MNILHPQDSNFPQQLQSIADSPKKLYYNGSLQALEQPCLSIIGARKHTQYAKHVLEQLLPEIVRHNITVVSGLAIGIDTLAHTQTLQLGGTTVGILGSGLDNHSIYPASNFALSKKILNNNGLLLTEYPPATKARKYHFVARNRIIAGISQATLIIEAAVKSGTLITANFALEEGRDVMCIPGDIHKSTSKGTNTLIQTGAHLITSAKDILEIMGIQQQEAEMVKSVETPLTTEEQQLLKCITQEQQELDKISIKSTLRLDQLLPLLVTLEIKGCIKKHSNGTYTLH